MRVVDTHAPHAAPYAATSLTTYSIDIQYLHMYNMQYEKRGCAMSNKDEYIQGLHWRLNALKEEIAELQARVQEIGKTIEVRRGQAQRIMDLLSAEGKDIKDPEVLALNPVAVDDVAYDYIKTRGAKEPIHYHDLAEALMTKGIQIPGQNPAANLLSHISRDDRFVRTAPGTYGLAEWGLSEMKLRRRRKARKHKKPA